MYMFYSAWRLDYQLQKVAVAPRSAMISQCVSFHLIKDFGPFPIIAALDRLRWAVILATEELLFNGSFPLQ